MNTTSGKLLCSHEVEYLKKRALRDKNIAGYEFRHYIDQDYSGNLEVETQCYRKPFLVECDRVNDLPGPNRAIWQL